MRTTVRWVEASSTTGGTAATAWARRGLVLRDQITLLEGVQVPTHGGRGQPHQVCEVTSRDGAALTDRPPDAVPRPRLSGAVSHKHNASVTYIHVRSNEGLPNLIPRLRATSGEQVTAPSGGVRPLVSTPSVVA